MQFSSVNENNEVGAYLILSAHKTVTRRRNLKPVGAIEPVRKTRRGSILTYIKILKSLREHELGDCIPRIPWYAEADNLQEEAKREGFKTWEGLRQWFAEHKISEDGLYRIEFRLATQEEIEEAGIQR